MGTDMITRRWGTWEELLLGGAVLRHGARDWNLVASELRTRSISPFDFTPEVCKAKYEDLRQRYSGSTAWFEELRKQRMEELRRALEKSEDSIGSLESKLETLKAEKGDDSRVGYDSSQTESALPCVRSEGVEFSSKDTYKDGLSAGSFTQEAETKWAPDCPVPVAVPAEEMDLKPGNSPTSAEREKISTIDNLADAFLGGQLRSIRKRRGKRKRKYCSPKEGSVGESEFLGASDFASVSWCKETSASNSAQIARSSGVEDQSRDSSKDRIDEIMGIFSSVAQTDCASVFRRRLDSQKRGRYKKMILRHMDFDTIKSRIGSNSINSVRELFRDMLLVANNALVFYSKNTREYKSALLLRHIVTTSLRQHFKEYRTKVPIATFAPTRPIHKPPAKPRSIRPGNHKPPGNAANNRNPVVGNSNVSKKPTNASSPPLMESLVVRKKGSARPRKGGCGQASKKSESAAKGRKRTRAR
ncbi:hypothetical protein ERO13_A10G022400v2 [Gossypium hirsutum]|uniref:Uncharacterized protein isoform X1 n=6 Tax=Gossypium TaxID=3633 RepID=A0A1U8L9I3_GOSHI|nr:uncharacterized protein LOC107925179 isoform X1 [Gossypium hirsutum]KAB2060536.1 hypothetical protein ES319_A10G024600v1 [Gossypium barbadense]KAG4178136.1 hypothetical protein ERO13_A10G022400v2 [Gossypium hirsutum]TYG97286.1 hypothetical protein ES288_A10G026600v1 [Gossypium darwinii]